MPNRNATKRRVALFRARDDAAGSAIALRRLGFSAVCLPVIDALPLAVAPRRPAYDAVIATSAKAFLRDAPIDHAAPLFVVGAKTARAAERRGWRIVAPPAPDSAHLIDLLARTISPGAAVLYLAGRDRKPAIEAALMTTHEMDIVEVYAAEARKHWTSKEIRVFGGCAAALHYSRRSAALAAELARSAGQDGHFRRMIHICMSADTAGPLTAAGAPDVRVAARPEEAALFTTLADAATVFPTHCGSRI
ncbi:uroporphyrinogen-III synthase [Roseiarcus fermentans]|uniref:Uroporphyrinogen-III synthase n=1 Tax=Roseiarcus fermentans TaxID=1473586 RepID=A0A366F7I1_9HYPH|nr:uroporphyrinogen-III synthase [Roseiarcus fermentans]RBP10598.1 uroporphyrinogen-III synthase [Roseiarcus fermentans]